MALALTVTITAEAALWRDGGDAAIANQLRIRPTMLAHSEWVSSIRKHQQTVSSSRTDANSPTWLNTKTNTHGSGNGGKASQPASQPVSLSAFVALRQALCYCCHFPGCCTFITRLLTQLQLALLPLLQLKAFCCCLLLLQPLLLQLLASLPVIRPAATSAEQLVSPTVQAC